jgi:hypothetical protein
MIDMTVEKCRVIRNDTVNIDCLFIATTSKHPYNSMLNLVNMAVIQ